MNATNALATIQRLRADWVAMGDVNDRDRVIGTVDQVGTWAAGQQATKKIMQILREAHLFRELLTAGQ
jgi:hypothetical protein